MGATGAAGDAIEFTGGANSLTVGSGSTTTGAIGLDTSSTTLDLVQASSGTLASAIVGAGAVTKDGAGTLTLSGTNSFSGGFTLNAGGIAVASDASLGATSLFIRLNGGTLETTADGFASNRQVFIGNGATFFGTNITAIIQVDTGTTTLSGQISDAASGGLNQTGALVKTGSGTLALTGNSNGYGGGTSIAAGTLDLGATTAAGTGAISFTAVSGTATARLMLETSAQAIGGTFTNTLANFNGGNDSLDLVGFAFNPIDTAYFSNGTSLTVMGGTTGTQAETFTLANGALLYTAKADAAGTGTLITAVACFCTGTLIRVARDGAEAEVAVETLAIGDRVVTASGAHRPVKWIGTRCYAGRFANNNPDVLPIRLKAGALTDNVPARDLWVSPKHALHLDGVLVPAEHLVNGASITKAERVESVTYWHIELDSHDILLAEGAPAESFVDDQSRGMFHNAHEFAALYPGEVGALAGTGTPARYCAPRVDHGFALQAIRMRLAARAGLALQASRFGALRGQIDAIEVEAAVTGTPSVLVRGWAQDMAHPQAPVCLDVMIAGQVVALAYADAYRGDLGAESRRTGFAVPLPAGTDAATVSVRRSADGAVLFDGTACAAARYAA